MNSFDYGAQAELYPSRSRGSRRQPPVGYKRFDRADEAIRFALEELRPESLVGAYLEVGEERFDANEMRALYESPDYPLPRNRPAGADKASAPGNASRSRAFAEPTGTKAVRRERS